jgi:hypothetical protein
MQNAPQHIRTAVITSPQYLLNRGYHQRLPAPNFRCSFPFVGVQVVFLCMAGMSLTSAAALPQIMLHKCL